MYGDQEMHNIVRQQCMDYMMQNKDFFAQYITEDFDSYIQRKRLDHCHGNHIEMQALSEMYNRTVEVYQCKNGIGEQINKLLTIICIHLKAVMSAQFLILLLFL